LAYVRADDVWIFDLDRGLDVALTEGGSGQHNPIWSPYGTHIVYRSGDDIMVRPVDRSTVLEPVTSTDQPDNPIEWLADGTLIVSTEGGPSGDLFALNIDDDEPARPLLDANWQERGASLSPDGRWLAYSSDRTKTRQLYVRSWPDLEGEILVSEGEANVTSQSYPQWSADGATL